MAPQYTTQLQAGLGMIDETRSLLQLWDDGMDGPALARAALASGRFPTMSARRVRNLVLECFGPRYVNGDARRARVLKTLMGVLSAREFQQLLFVYTCRAHAILADFVCEVYWPGYAAGREAISNDEARDFVVRANEDGRTAKHWSPATIRRVASYLTGACADFGLLESGRRSVRRILPLRVESRVVAVLAYDLHFAGLGDNRVLADPQWALLGVDREDVLAELRRLSLKGLFIIQSAGNVTRIGWQCKTIEELADVIAES